MGHDEPPYDANNPILRRGRPVQQFAYLTDALTREAVDLIERRQNRPSFVLLAYNAVHSPQDAGQPGLYGVDCGLYRSVSPERATRHQNRATLAALADTPAITSTAPAVVRRAVLADLTILEPVPAGLVGLLAVGPSVWLLGSG